MIRVSVVEDDKKYAQLLEKLIKRYGQERNIDFFVEFFENGMDFISDYPYKTDIIFMDIEMPHMNGMDCAVKLREIDGNVPLIFVTNMMQYAIRGYEVDAVGYMVKPVKYFRFSVLMDKVVSRIEQETSKDVCVHNRDQIKRISTRDIYYVEVMDHYLIYHTTSGEYQEIGRMKDAEKQLCDFGFFRCSNSHLVNLSYVQGIKKDEVIMIDKETIFASRRRKKEFLTAMNDFLKKGGV